MSVEPNGGDHARQGRTRRVHPRSWPWRVPRALRVLVNAVNRLGNASTLALLSPQSGVVATVGPHGRPQAALVGIAATDDAEIVFDTSRNSRKFANIARLRDVALVIGWDDEVTVQLEGPADVPTGTERERCLAAYFDQYPDGRQRAESPNITHIRVRPRWVRYSDFRPETFGSHEFTLDWTDGVAPR
ncbi:MAG: pyridoxamine 5'-phosphate oxidase family protein [Sciscionella sp.]|nr:pyridoxamine 5'-phosphate oxidase family protein [Sciscionella sp.]